MEIRMATERDTTDGDVGTQMPGKCFLRKNIKHNLFLAFP